MKTVPDGICRENQNTF